MSSSAVIAVEAVVEFENMPLVAGNDIVAFVVPVFSNITGVLAATVFSIGSLIIISVSDTPITVNAITFSGRVISRGKHRVVMRPVASEVPSTKSFASCTLPY